ncbi:MAG: glycoside hydrolase family 16 protein [Treponema sp.]|jgi:beta-glucanase (GH16 family)|nr:glycoside hydrolase family 16 protein [Treponema sp.]
MTVLHSPFSGPKKAAFFWTAVLLAAVSAFAQNGGKTVVTSGRVNTMGKFSFQYGILEASVKIPKTADGLWPALWLLGGDYPEKSWPACGEIDILEMGHKDGIAGGIQDKLFNGAAHWGDQLPDGSHPNYAVYRKNLYGLQHGDFHLFTLVWDEHSIKMYLDRDKIPAGDQPSGSSAPNPPPGGPVIPPGMKPYFEMAITPELAPYFHKPFFIVINLAAGGTFTGIFSVEGISALNKENSNRASLYVDYIRVYNKSGALIFNQDFDSSRLDTRLWNIEENDGGGGNRELQSYRRASVRVEKDRASGKSCLVLTARKENS